MYNLKKGSLILLALLVLGTFSLCGCTRGKIDDTTNNETNEISTENETFADTTNENSTSQTNEIFDNDESETTNDGIIDDIGDDVKKGFDDAKDSLEDNNDSEK